MSLFLKIIKYPFEELIHLFIELLMLINKKWSQITHLELCYFWIKYLIQKKETESHLNEKVWRICFPEKPIACFQKSTHLWYRTQEKEHFSLILNHMVAGVFIKVLKRQWEDLNKSFSVLNIHPHNYGSWGKDHFKYKWHFSP